MRLRGEAYTLLLSLTSLITPNIIIPMKKTREKPRLWANVGELLAADLAAADLTQRAFAQLLNVGEATVNRLLHNRERVTARRALLISHHTNRPAIEYLIAQAHTDLEREQTK